ncbi:MAG: HlyC/CorC family transporter [Ruminococcus sp.]|nr:HlyC/CorC family transporter [Ruminococcus sp.]
MDIVIIVLLLALSAICSATETAFSSANRIRLKNMAASGKKSAVRALDITENFDKALTAILIGNNIFNLSASSLTTVMFTKRFGSGSVAYATIVLTVLVLIFGEILPKSLAKENSESFSMLMSAPLSIAMMILTPAIWFFTVIKKLAVKLTGSRSDQPSFTEEELKYIIDESETEGVLEEQESDLVRSALDFDETMIDEVLVPRVNIVGIGKDADMDTLRKTFEENCYSRLPVYDRTMDNIVGIVHLTDFYRLYLDGADSFESVVTAPVFIPENKRISEVMRLMQKKKVHMAVVVDQYGGTEGIVTLEDILEELVGDIYDEHDEEDDSFIRLGSDRWRISGELSISDFLEKAELDDDMITADATSMGGWVLEQLERLPINGERLTADGFDIAVGMKNGNKIDTLTIGLAEDKKE